MPKTAKRKRRLIPQPVLDLVNKMGLTHDRHVCWTVECGLHSGIPPCCVMHYVMLYTPLLEDDRLSREIAEENGAEDDEEFDYYVPGAVALIDYQHMLRRYGVEHGYINYVPCPACFLAGNFVTLKDCDCHRKRTYPLLHEV